MFIYLFAIMLFWLFMPSYVISSWMFDGNINFTKAAFKCILFYDILLDILASPHKSRLIPHRTLDSHYRVSHLCHCTHLLTSTCWSFNQQTHALFTVLTWLAQRKWRVYYVYVVDLLVLASQYTVYSPIAADSRATLAIYIPRVV